ncbi:DUF1080 domain-containing protein [Sphingobacterium shayense]|uniref:3-keto-disaccharide hydrolase n=1 Tax=Sphingobacterium shayense TaxID=626343 RepID=UPI001556EAE1|nr:DUF1080 domain-containing protein [Sphingobacterium shayense]NQD69427.1 DUF1080 domain-containing protein [Sphingobacterium shayense]
MKLNLLNTIFLPLLSSVVFFACSSPEEEPNKLTEEEKETGWELLFDGKSLNNWHIYNKKNIPAPWVVQNGTIYCDPTSDTQKGDLISNNTYENYEFTFEWKLEKEGNSGVFINVIEDPTIDATYHSGPEYQLLDDAHVDFDKPLKRSGCLYTFSPQKNFVNTKPRNEWNQSRIVQKDGKVTFYLNDVMTAETDFNSSEWKAQVTRSAFKNYPEFGKNTKGKIALQDWSRGVSFRNIKIRNL